jgi:hypothetical protein
MFLNRSTEFNKNFDMWASGAKHGRCKILVIISSSHSPVFNIAFKTNILLINYMGDRLVALGMACRAQYLHVRKLALPKIMLYNQY